MSDDRSWLTDEYPELRDGPPWVMQDMIEMQTGLPAAILAENAAATAVAELVRSTAATGDPIVVVGCGTSEHGAMAVAHIIADAYPEARVEARQSLDAALAPRPGGLCIGVSHDGGTRATLLAMESARSAGATIAAVTSQASGQIARAAEEVVVTPEHDVSWCHTLAYTSNILAGAAIAGSAPSVDRLTEVIANTLDARPALAEAAAALIPGRRIITTGLGSDEIAARELALKIEEGARIPATAHHLETFLHGHLAGCDADTTAVARLSFDPSGGQLRDERSRDVDAALAAIGIPRVVLAEPAQTATEALVASAVALQLLTLELAEASGTNPDLIRREQKPYRDAAEASGG